MELKAWIEQLPVEEGTPPTAKAAELLGEKKRTVESWLRFEAVPSFGAALNITRKTDGAVDFNGIYSPFVVALLQGRARFRYKDRS